MATLTWGDSGTRRYETGVDRGVLFVEDAGVAWNGLVSVDENPSGGDVEAYYIDGIQYMNSADVEDFGATIGALYSPAEFDACEGIIAVELGMYASQQKRKPFSLSYRTRIGNDLDGPVKGYKIHIIYNALLAPPKRTYKTIGETLDPSVLSWSFTVKPVAIPGLLPSAHLIIDSTEAPAFGLFELESILYGTSDTDPRLPLPDEIAAMFEGTSEFTVTDLGGGEFRISGSSIEVSLLDTGVYQIDSIGVTLVDPDTYEITSP
jgi:hypothetical protein